MDLVGTVVEQTQRLLDRGFLLSAYIPLAATVLAVWCELAGVDEVVGQLERLAGGTAAEAAVVGGLTLVGLYLAAFVVHGLRRALRDAWSGAIPVRLVREALVSRKCQRHAQLQRRLDQLGYGLGAAYWLANDGLDPERVSGVDDPPFGTGEVNEVAEACRTRLRTLRWRWVPFAASRAQRLLLDLQRLANADPPTTASRAALDAVRRTRSSDAPADRRALDRLTAAAVRLEQRFRRLDDHLNQSYPPTAAMQATSLGNVLARAEHYSSPRYAIPLQTLWPRLRLVAPDKALADVDDALVRIDFALAMSTGGVVAAITGLVAAIVDAPTPERVAIGLGAAVATVALYRLAVVSAHLYGAQIAATVDLNLPDLEERLAKLSDHAVNWDALHHFFARADALPAPAEAEQGQSAPNAPTQEPGD